MSNDRKDKEMICGLTADEHEILRRELGALPLTMPPRAVWQRIREQAEAEGLVGLRPLRRPVTWTGGIGLAAAVVLAVALGLRVTSTGNVPGPYTEPAAGGADDMRPVTTLQTLMVQSRQLESELSALPAQPRVVRAGTAATISDLEDRIAAIDFQLNDPGIVMTPEEEEIFWRERVRLMKLLVGLRYAQAQQAAF
jgi:hypothetical protein